MPYISQSWCIRNHKYLKMLLRALLLVLWGLSKRNACVVVAKAHKFLGGFGVKTYTLKLPPRQSLSEVITPFCMYFRGCSQANLFASFSAWYSFMNQTVDSCRGQDSCQIAWCSFATQHQIWEGDWDPTNMRMKVRVTVKRMRMNVQWPGPWSKVSGLTSDTPKLPLKATMF